MKINLGEIKKIISKKADLNDTNISRLLIKLSIPAIIAIFVNSFYNIMDSIFVGRGVGADAIGALTISAPIQHLIMSFAMMVSSGAMSVLSRSLGEGNEKKASKCFGNSVSLIVLISLIITIVGLVFLEPLIAMFGGRGQILEYAKEYMRIIFLGTVFMGLSFIFAELLRSEGKGKESMMVMAIGAISNIILDYIFIIILNGGVSGAAFATTLANVISFIYGLICILKGKSILKFKLEYFILRIKLVKEMLSVGVSSLISQGAGSISQAIGNIIIVSVGGEMLINSIGVFNRINSLIFMPIFGVVQGMQPIVGYNYGAKRMNKVKECVLLTLKSVFVIALVNMLIIQLCTKQMVSLFISDSVLIENSVPYVRIAIMFTAIGAWQCVGGTVFRALGLPKKAFLFSLLRQIVIFVPAMIILSQILGELGCWLAFPTADLLSGVISREFIVRYINKVDKNLTVKEVS